MNIEIIKRYFEPELLFWLIALIYLAFINTGAIQHFSFCLFRNLGIDWCPGCGLGRSISFLLHGDISQSFHSHWFGPLAFIVILIRIYQLIRSLIFKNKIIFQ